MKYKNYIFDFGRVIVDFEPEVMLSPYIADKSDREIVGSVVFDRFYWDRLDIGEQIDDELISGIKERLPVRLHKPAIDAYKNWYYHLPYVEGMCELIGEIKASGGKLYLLSNISTDFAENYKHVTPLKDLFSLFDGLVFSGPLQLIKPDLAIFRYLLDKYNLNANECVFIDDNINNINAAQELSFNTYLFDRNIKRLKKEIF